MALVYRAGHPAKTETCKAQASEKQSQQNTTRVALALPMRTISQNATLFNQVSQEDRLKVYLIRHAPAVDMTHRMTDPQVHLSLEGRRIVRAVGTVLRNKEISFEMMISSPYTRAVQTAELLAERVDYLGAIEANNAFIPEMSPRVALAEISTYNVDVAVVAHEPLLSALGALLIGRPSFPPFKRGQISCIEDGNPSWFVDPQFLEVKPLLVA